MKRVSNKVINKTALRDPDRRIARAGLAGCGLLIAIGLGGCWQSSSGLIDESKATQPFAEGTYVEHDWPDKNSSKQPGQPIMIKKSGSGYRAQWGSDGQAFDVIVVPFDSERHDFYAYQATQVACTGEACGEGDRHVYYGLLGMRGDGRIVRIEPEQADPEGKVAKAAGASCDDSNMCEFTTRDALMAALAQIADTTPSLTYQPAKK